MIETLSEPRAVVTGGAGFIGSTLVDRLVDDGLNVLVVDDLSSGRLDNLAAARRSGAVQFHQIDVREEMLGAVITRFAPSVVFHLAAQSNPAVGRRDLVADAAVNITGSVNVLESSRLAGVERLVYVTSAVQLFSAASGLPFGSRAKPHPGTPGGVAAAAMLEYLRYGKRAFGFDYVALGTSSVYGPRQGPEGPDGAVMKIVRALLAGNRPSLPGDGSQTRDFVFVEDVVDAAVRAAVRGGGRYFHIATGVETSLIELVALLGVITGRKRRPELDHPTEGETARSVFDPGPASTRLGWRPWTTLREGLRQTVDWVVPG